MKNNSLLVVSPLGHAASPLGLVPGRTLAVVPRGGMLNNPFILKVLTATYQPIRKSF